ncbi:hypothetical protein MMC11_006997 [Xylographa trunciseda]|nr:hypothetical protein [Xylographa trunciseda]
MSSNITVPAATPVGEGIPRQDDNILSPSSFTAQRLHHASPQHLHTTTRRCFIGPIPEDWLRKKDHRKAWYKHSLNFSRYSSRAATFYAGDNVSNRKQTTGIDSTSGPEAYRQSFPQPDDVNGHDAQDSHDAPSSGPSSTAISSGDLRNEASTDIPTSKTSQKPLGDPTQSSGEQRESSDHQYHIHVGSPDERASQATTKSAGAASFVTAPESRRDELKSLPQRDMPVISETNEQHSAEPGTSRFSTGSSLAAVSTFDAEVPSPADAHNSTSSLLHDAPVGALVSKSSRKMPPKESAAVSRDDEGTVDSTAKFTELRDVEPEGLVDSSATDLTAMKKTNSISTGLVRFNLPDELADDEQWAKTKIADVIDGKSIRQLRKSKSRSGVLIKSEKMLVRVDYTVGELPPDYDENVGLGSETRTIEKWREFVVVCRKSTDDKAAFVIQLYKTRVIPAVEQAEAKKRYTYEIPLIRKTTKLNMYSSLDKTIVLWAPWKRGTRMYILRARSLASSVEWYTFLRSALGWKRSSSLKVNVPDLNVTLQIAEPFKELEVSHDTLKTAKSDVHAMMNLIDSETTAASTVINRCLDMLQNSPEWSDVIDTWLKQEKMGLAWKRYDRLEWVYGINEHKMYGTIAMERSHDLELRPKQHYPTTAVVDGESSIEEPPAVEGFLVRLTSQKGREKRYGKMFSKKSYFSTHNQFLCYCKPGKAMVPTPPELPKLEGEAIPSLSQIADNIPLIYGVNPYPIEKGEISWLVGKGSNTVVEHDQNAFDETERKINMLTETDGYVNLCSVTSVREVQRGDSTAPNQGEQSSSPVNVGQAQQAEDARTFELIIKNGLVVRLMAYNEATKTEWMTRLTQISTYWKLRTSSDMELYKMVRRTNLETLEIDEEMESFIGQYARKWEVTRSIASPQLFNMCGISCCRTITMAGSLYRKPRMHSTFKRCSVILCHGRLLVFEETLRKSSGKEIPHILHERQDVLELKDTYIYSGMITEGDLLYQNQTFDSNHPGHHALPRVYLNDGWTSSDEDTTTCFVIWQGQKKSLFMANPLTGDGKMTRRLRYVSRLGVPGRSIVFKARSRAERDQWVINIGMEIERLQQAEEIRVVAHK